MPEPEACNFIKKETLTEVLSCEFFENSKNIFSYRTTPVAASVFCFCHKVSSNKNGIRFVGLL